MLLKNFIKITALSGKYSGDDAEVTITYTAVTDDWRDGPLTIAVQGTSENILNERGEVLGWLARGKPYVFGNERDERIVASDVEVTDRTVLSGESEYELRIQENNVKLERNSFRRAVVRWTIKQSFKKPGLENQEDKEGDDREPSPEDNFTLEYGKEWIDAPLTRDVNTGKPIVNSAGDPFIPTPTCKKALRTFTLTRRERVNRLHLFEQYENVVNLYEWYGAKPATVLMESVTPSWDGNVFTVKYQFKYNENGWGEKYLDTGLRELSIYEIPNEDDDTIVTIKERKPILSGASQTPVEEPVKLDGAGKKPIHRETKEYPFIDIDGNIVKDSETGEELWYETGNPVYVTDKNGKRYEKPYENYPGVDLPMDENIYNGKENKWELPPYEDQHFFWKYKAMDFEPLKLPNPYDIKLKPLPIINQ
jgi:hypothetical protein